MTDTSGRSVSLEKPTTELGCGDGRRAARSRKRESYRSKKRFDRDDGDGNCVSNNHRHADHRHIGYQIDLQRTSGTIIMRTSGTVGVIVPQQARQQRDRHIQPAHESDNDTPFHTGRLSPIVAAVKSLKFTSLIPDSSISLRAVGLHSACNSPACW